MSEGIEERLRHEASEGNGIISRVYAGDVIEVIDALRSQLAAAEAWKNAVVDALVVSWEYGVENKDNPVQAISDLLAMAQREALDPAISEQAKALVDRAEVAEKALAEAKGLLKELEFSDISDWGCFCPVCGKEKHTNNCRLAATIAGVE